MIAFAEQALDLLARASLQGAVLIAVVWAVCRLLPRLPASLRCALWWLACLQLLVGLVWMEPVHLPLLPAAETVVTNAPIVPSTPVAGSPVQRVETVQVIPAAPQEPGFPWALAALGVWLTGLTIHLVLAVAQLRETRRVVRGAEPVAVPWMRQAFAEILQALGLRRPPELRSSAAIASPQALGLLRPLVLLPRTALDRLSPGEVTMTLCHEALHVRRGDLWLGWVPALAERLFFFHPLAALAAREYALAREAACDAEVLRVLGAAPQDYGRLLVRLGVSPRQTGMAAAGASPSFLNLKRRLQMLQASSERSRRSGAWWIVPVVLLAGVVPYRIVAAEAKSQSAVEPVPAVAPADAVKPVPAVAARPAAAPKATVAPAKMAKTAKEGPKGNRTGPPPAPPAPPAPPVPPAPPLAKDGKDGKDVKKHAKGERPSGESYALRVGQHIVSHGDMSDPEMNEALEASGDMLWFRRGGKKYVIRDATTLQRASKLFEQQVTLGQQQAELGEKQAELGAKQAELSHLQVATNREEMELQRQKERGGYDAEERKALDELAEKRAKLEEMRNDLIERQQELAGRQTELGNRQSEQANQADRALRAVIDEAVQRGLAREIR